MGRVRSHSQEQLKKTSSQLTRRSSRPLPQSILPRLAPLSLPHCLPRKRRPSPPRSQPSPPRSQPSPPRSRRPRPLRSSQPSPLRLRPTPRQRISTRPAARRLAQQLTSGVWPRAHLCAGAARLFRLLRPVPHAGVRDRRAAGHGAAQRDAAIDLNPKLGNCGLKESRSDGYERVRRRDLDADDE